MRVKRTYRPRATELVRQLGYYDIEKSEDRPYEALKKATCDFRKNYQLKQLAGASFPLDPKDPRVTECVVSFLDAHSELFKASKEAIDHGWPIITVAEDKAKIVTILPELFCLQALNFQYNQGTNLTKKNKQRQKHKYHMDDVDSSSDPGNRHETSEDEVASFTDLETKDPITAIDSSVLDPSEIRDNIQIHLDYVYPLDQPRIHGDYRWISSSNLEISEIDPFLIATVHELNLYHTCEASVCAFDTLKWIYSHCLTIPYTRKARLRKQCKDIIQNLVPRLVRCGFVVPIDGGFQKSPEFEGAWRLRRHQYIDIKFGGSLIGVIGFELKPPSKALCSHSGPQKPKRKNKRSAIKSKQAGPVNAPKRQKVRGDETDYELPDDDDDRTCHYTTHGKGKDRCTEEMNMGHIAPKSSRQPPNSSPRPASTSITPYSPMNTTESAPPDPTIRDRSSKTLIISSAVDNDSSITVSAYATYSTTVPEQKLESVLTRSRELPTLDTSDLYNTSRAGSPDVVFISENRIKSPSTLPTVGDSGFPPVKSESEPPSLNTSRAPSATVIQPKSLPAVPVSGVTSTSTSAGKLPTPTSPTPEGTIPKHSMEFSLDPYEVTGSGTSADPYKQALVRAPSTQQTEPMELTLQFAIEDENCVNDDEPSSLVSLRKISSLDVRALFRVVRERSGRSPNALTFTTQWQEVEHMVVLVVRQSAGEEAWERVKRRLDAILKNEKRVYRGKKVPELVVWVSCGDRTKVDCEA